MSRTALIALVSAAALAAGSMARAQSGTATAPAAAPVAAPAATHPAWVDDTLEPDGRARISRLESGSPDLVVLDRGLYAGLRVGASCLVDHNSQPVAELVIVASQSDCAVALITSEGKGVTLQSGDSVRLKLITRVI